MKGRVWVKEERRGIKGGGRVRKKVKGRRGRMGKM